MISDRIGFLFYPFFPSKNNHDKFIYHNGKDIQIHQIYLKQLTLNIAIHHQDIIWNFIKDYNLFHKDYFFFQY